MDFLRRIGEQAGLGDWQAWSAPQRVIAVVVAALFAYWVLRTAVPALLRLLTPVFLVLLVLVGLWAAFPDAVCSLSWTSKLPLVCGR